MTAAERPVVIHQYPSVPRLGESKFDGGLFGLLGCYLLILVGTVLTLGLAYPWLLCMLKRWEARHTSIDGHRLFFNGTGMQLIGKWIVWLLLSIITLGIYLLWLPIRIKQWTIKHTTIA